jgi:exonuclease SbcC
LAERCKSLRGEGARLPDLEARKDEMVRLLGLKDAELKRTQADLAAVGYQEGDLKAASAGYDRAFAAREAAYGEVSRRATALELTTERLGDKRASLSDILEKEKSIAERARKVEQLATLEKVMGDFKQNVMERVVPTLSEVSSQFFSEMTDSKYGGIELDEDYEMQVYDGKDKYPVSRFSGGEGDLANLCLRLAISRVLADRSGNDINFLILDEIFGSQDQVRKRNIMSTLNRLEKQFHQIILITHIDDTKDYMNNVITIRELEDGTSTVEQ